MGPPNTIFFEPKDIFALIGPPPPPPRGVEGNPISKILKKNPNTELWSQHTTEISAL